MAKIEITEEQLQGLVKSAVEAALLARAPDPTLRGQDERVQQMVDEMNGLGRAMARERLIPCVSNVTDATFKLRVVESRAYPQGRIVDLVDYKYPEGVDKHVSEGGRVPTGLAILNKNNGNPLPLYKQWLWDNFWKADLIAYNGKAYSKRYAPEGAADVPWTQPEPMKKAG